MQTLLKMYDETLGQPRREAGTLRLASERMTLRQLVRRRIEEDAANLGVPSGQSAPMLVTPVDREQVLNSHRINVEDQVRVACEAIERNRIIVLFGERQLTDLDAEIFLDAENTATFIKLMPLVAG